MKEAFQDAIAELLELHSFRTSKENVDKVYNYFLDHYHELYNFYDENVEKTVLHLGSAGELARK